MSTRHLLNMTMGAVATLLLAAIGIAFTTTGQGDEAAARNELAARQQLLVQNLTQEAAALVAAGNVDDANRARTELGRTIVQFDQALTALLHGGVVPVAAGRSLTVPAAGNGRARKALEEGARLWIETGLPLSDLAAGEYSVFSAAGRRALEGLESNHVALMGSMADAAGYFVRSAQARHAAGRYARWAVAGLALALASLVWRRRRPQAVSTPETAAASAATVDEAAREAATAAGGPIVESIFRRPSASEPATYNLSLDFDSVNAAVDQMSVDMNTIAGSTDKMRLAIDSVGYALQGMLYSLREMSQDTAEGHRIVRGANNAATFTADAAEQLVASAREMAQVVSRVTQLALKTKQVAGQIEGEAIDTGQTGEAFTSVVANEVKGLAQQTNHATAEIDQTVGAILATAREYEEAIGQIIKNIAQINKVSQNLGKLMLDPPARVVPGVAVSANPASLNAAAPTPDATVVREESPDEPPVPDAVIEPADDPVDPEPSPQEVAEQTSDAIAAAATALEDVQDVVAAEETPAPAPADGGSNGNVFMLGKPRKRPAVKLTPPDAAEAAVEPAPDPPAGPATEPDPEPASEPTAEPPVASTTETTPVPEIEPETAAANGPPVEPTAADEPAADGGSNKNVFMLNKPKPAVDKKSDSVAEVVDSDPAPPSTDDANVTDDEPAAGPAPSAGVTTNIFMLNMPASQGATPSASTEAVDTPDGEVSDAANETATEPKADDADESSGASPNVFMLNKPD